MSTEKHYYRRGLKTKLEKSRLLSQLRTSSKIKHELKPQLIVVLKKQHGENLVGEIIEARSDSHYVVRKVTKKGLEASPLEEYRSDRPHTVTLPNGASGMVVDKNKVTSRYKKKYRNILLEINKEGGNVEIPLENKDLFDLF